MPRGASGSSQMSAKHCVPAGTSDQAKRGDRSGPSAVCFFGMGEPSANADDSSFMALHLVSPDYSPQRHRDTEKTKPENELGYTARRSTSDFRLSPLCASVVPNNPGYRITVMFPSSLM